MLVKPILNSNDNCCNDAVNSKLTKMSKCLLDNIRFGFDNKVDNEKFIKLVSLQDIKTSIINCNPCLKGYNINDVDFLISKL